MSDAELPFLDLASADFSTRSDAVRQARDQNWCARTPFGLAVLRHREVGFLLRDKRLRQGSYAWPDTHDLEGTFAEFWKRSIISTTGETHKTLRNIAVPALHPDFIDSLRPGFSEIAESLCLELRQKDACEFMSDFSVPFAGMAICLLLGMDTSEWPQISHDASDLGLAMGVNCKSHEPTFNTACDRLMRLSNELIAKVRAGEDENSYVARLVSQFDINGIKDQQMLLDLVVISIFGGVDTTRSQLGLGMALFAEFPEQWEILRKNPLLIPQAIEEMIQARPTTTWSTREAAEDFEFSGQQIKKGETLHMLVHASARDPLICEDPLFDITKKRKIHFGFGGGAHHCIGAQVARTDMACALECLTRNISEFSIVGTPSFLPDSGNTSPIELRLKLGFAD